MLLRWLVYLAAILVVCPATERGLNPFVHEADLVVPEHPEDEIDTQIDLKDPPSNLHRATTHHGHRELWDSLLTSVAPTDRVIALKKLKKEINTSLKHAMDANAEIQTTVDEGYAPMGTCIKHDRTTKARILGLETMLGSLTKALANRRKAVGNDMHAEKDIALDFSAGHNESYYENQLKAFMEPKMKRFEQAKHDVKALIAQIKKQTSNLETLRNGNKGELRRCLCEVKDDYEQEIRSAKEVEANTMTEFTTLVHVDCFIHSLIKGKNFTHTVADCDQKLAHVLKPVRYKPSPKMNCN